MKTEKWALIRRVLRYARPYRGRIIVLLLVILITTGLGLVQPLIFRDLIDVTLQQDDLSRLNLMAGLLVVVPLVNAAIRIHRRRLNASISEGVVFDLRRDLYSHLQRMPVRFFTHTRTGELISRLNNDVRDAQQMISSTTISVVTQVIRLIALLGMMAFLEWRLLALGILLLPIYIPLSKRSSEHMDTIAREKAYRNAAMNTLMHETLNIGGVFLVKLFGQRDAEIERFTDHAEAVRDIHIEKAQINEQFGVLFSLLGAFGIAGVYWLGGYFVLRGVFTIGTIVAFATYLSQFYSTLQNLSGLPPTLATSLVSFERVFEIIDMPPEIDEIENPVRLEQIRGEVCFEHVYFSYSSEDVLSSVERNDRVDAVFSGANSESTDVQEVTVEAIDDHDSPLSQARVQALQDINFEAKPGQLVALVGPSGAGKTTLTYLIPRLYDPDRGRITLDGYDLRQLALDSLVSHIGVVTQDTYLFHDTIATNLRYARPNATMDEIVEACKAAHIHDFINELPQGYETIVGERGYRLSGGEKQRLAIARVILKAPQILILDEATSHLDSQSEKLIQEAMERIIKGRTSFVIAHRLSTIQSADLILVMNRGQIVEQGTHETLLVRGGLYADLYYTQFAAVQESL